MTHWGNTNFNHVLTSFIRDILYFYIYLHIHVLVADQQFLLLIDVPIQDNAQQLEIYEVFNLALPHGNFSAQYKLNSRYLGKTND